ncbi:helix-turn-helix domain-containing protein [Nocardiopsis lambiniae]|uniref:Helix-turn-helix transcriptional regulator n=1 Tax=Nocardiopsis lambiniae TaxID=3075539 RepID=A0ABU2MDR2_9ACTN|nr:helix-turn-helix transcriptional regulator [Nocardiopsis sp. DSM 44743]MDT0330757.1 helix-turn-helix transcriptional regulator [Nocardiopsis sp. DSM 44743]
MTQRYSPTVRRRRLSEELRRRRTNARMTLDDAAQATEISRTTVSNIESGVKKRPQINEIKALLDAYGVTEERERDEILNLTRQSRESGWWSRYKDVLSGKFIGFEAEAAVISTWEPLVVPGLLQVPEYIRAVARAARMSDEHGIQRAIDARIERQRILASDPPELWAVFSESILLSLTDFPDVLRQQVEYLLEAAEAPTTTIQMTPERRLTPGLGGPFVIMDFPEVVDPSVVYLETDTDGLYLESPEEVARYRNIFGHLHSAAMTPEQTVERLKEMIT